ATRLVTDGTDCASGYYARGVDAYGNAELCAAVPSGGHGDGTNCSAGYYPLGVDANGNVQSCTAVPSGGHGDGTDCAAGYYARGVDANGNAELCTAVPTLPSDPTFNSVTAGSYYYSSDAKLKMNIKTISDPLEKITSLRGVTFNWKDSKEPSVGLIAQEVEKVFPELVGGNGNYKAVEYGNLVAPLIEAIKAQQQQIEQLEARIMSLESSR
nr:tail fiber domain-containing protein [Patescibacteria group bacterium]